MTRAYYRKARLEQLWQIAFITCFLLVFTSFLTIPSPARAAGNEYLDVSFGGTFTPQKGYTTGGDENVAGGKIAWRGSSTPSANEDRSIKLVGGDSGITYTARDSFSQEGTNTVDNGFIAEVEYTNSENPKELDTLFSAMGNIFVRAQGNHLVYGFSVKTAGNTWKDYKNQVELPEINKKHVVQIEYATAESASLTIWVDGVKSPVVSAAVGEKAAITSGAEKIFGIGCEVNPDASAANRGFAGSFSRVRIADVQAEWELLDHSNPGDNNPNIGEENCDISTVRPANTIDVSQNDCEALIRAKLSALRPTEKQADYLDWGQIGFVHFNVNTFTGNSWGHGDESPSVINAQNIDTDQWARTFADAGFKMMMVTVKHHDGFLLFDSRYNDAHDWPNTTTAKNGGTQDLFAEIVNSAHKYGLKVGVYYSPADSYMEKQGIFGNGSAKKERTIPTLVENDDRAARVASGELPTFKFEATDYGQYMLNQLYELLTDYGTIDEVWFDGAQGNTENPEYYDYDAFYDLIGKLQPNALQANAAPDARWIGNEDGWARQTEWNPQGVDFDKYGKIVLHPSQMAPDGQLGSTESIIAGVRSGKVTKVHWYPGEVDAKNGPEWFNNSNKAGPNIPKPMSQIVKFYEQSTGRNAQFLLNIPPYIDGRIPAADVAVMRGYREELLRRYGSDLALGKEASVAAGSSSQALAAAVEAPKLTDGSKLTSDESQGNTPVYTVKLGAPHIVDAVILSEDARNNGQQVERFKVQGLTADGQWQNLGNGTTIGQQRNIRFAQPATVSEIRVQVEAARGQVRLSRMEVYNSESEIQDVPRAYFIDPNTQVAGDGTSAERPMASIEALHDVSLAPGSVILVKRGTTLTGDFAVFGYGSADNPITLTTYGTGAEPIVALNDVEATSLAQLLPALGKDKAGWRYTESVTDVPSLRQYVKQDQIRIVAQSSENAGDGLATNLLDGRLDTIWHSQWQPTNANGPHWVVLDLGENYDDLQSLNYLARTGSVNGVAREYQVWVSDSSDRFTGTPLRGTLENVPYTQRIDLGEARGRYIKFQIDSDYSGAGFGSGAELNVERTPLSVPVPETSHGSNTPGAPDNSNQPTNPDNSENPSDRAIVESPSVSSAAADITGGKNEANVNRKQTNNDLVKTGADIRFLLLVTGMLGLVGGITLINSRNRKLGK